MPPRERGRLDKPVRHPKAKAARLKKKINSGTMTVTQTEKTEQKPKLSRSQAVAESNRRRVKHPWPALDARYINGYEAPDSESGVISRYWPTQVELAQEFNIPLDTVNQHARAYKWTEKREEYKVQLKKAAEEADLLALKEAELRIRRKSLKAAEKIIDRVGGSQNVQGEIKDLVDIIDPSDLASLGTALRRGQEVANVAIGIPKDGVRPPNTDAPGGETRVTVWARMRDSRQDVVVGVQVVNES